MDPFTTNRIAKALEEQIIKSSENAGHEVHVRLLLKKYLNEEITKETTETLALGLGILFRGGFMTEKDIMTIMKHLGVLL